MTLFVERSGQGRDLVMLHGWGLHGGFFGALMLHLEPHFRVHRVDLPGHGRSRGEVASGLDSWVDAVRASVPKNAIWLGWSLGGILAMHAALKFPEQVERLALVASTPRFVTDTDWPHAQKPEVLAHFAGELHGDFRKTVSDFLTLQSLGDTHAREQVRELRPMLFDHGNPEPEGLAAGLDILRDADLRDALHQLHLPVLLVAGQRDRLTPPAAMCAAAKTLPDAMLELYEGAAHMPFLSDPTRFGRQLKAFADVA